VKKEEVKVSVDEDNILTIKGEKKFEKKLAKGPKPFDQPQALEHDPMTVKRLRRLREQRAAQRSARRRGFEYAT